MFILSKIFQVFLFPPGLFIILTTAGFVLLLVKRRKLAIILFSFSIGCMYILSVQPVKDALLVPLENAYPPITESAHSFNTAENIPVVVLGGGAVARSPAEDYQSAPSGGSLKRLIYGIRIRQQTGGTLFISGGTVYQRKGAEPEALAAKRIAMELGVPEEMITIETNSRNTWENAVETKRILMQKAKQKIILVTTAYHMKRSVMCFEAQGFTVIPAPTDYFIDRAERSVMSPLPTGGALGGSSAALHEYWGLLYYRFRYMRQQRT